MLNTEKVPGKGMEKKNTRDGTKARTKQKRTKEGVTVKLAGAVVTGFILIVVVFNAISGDNRNAWNPAPVRLDNITAEKVAALFDKIYEYGFAENKNRSLKNQFLVVFLASLSDMEVEVHKWETLPMNFRNHSAERTLFLLNNSTCSDDPRHALHREVIAIDYGHIDRMVSDFVADGREKGEEEWPLVFMYSWYIPCSEIADIGYSCAEELMNYARNRKDKLGVVVAYSHVYRDTCCNTGRQTNETYSRLAMEDGGLVAFNRRDQGHYEQTVNYSAPRILEPNVSTFQYEFYSCLLNSEVAACCTSVQASDHISSFHFMPTTSPIDARRQAEKAACSLKGERVNSNAA